MVCGIVLLLWPLAARPEGLLAKVGGESPWETIASAADAGKHRRAIDEIVVTGEPGAGRRLMALFSKRGLVQATLEREVVLAFGRLGYRPALSLLWSKLRRASSPLVRGACLEALAMIEGERVLPLLMRGLGRRAYRAAARRAMIRLGGAARQTAERLLRQGGAVAREAARVLSALRDPRSIDSLRRALEDSLISPATAARALATFGGERAGEVLDRLLLHGRAAVRRAAWDAVRRRRRKSASAEVTGAVGMGLLPISEGLRWLADVAPAGRGTVGATLVKSPQPDVRRAALELTARAGDPSAIPLLASLAKPQIRSLYYEVIDALAVSGSPRAVGVLARHMKWSGRVGGAAVYALGTLLRGRGHHLAAKRAGRKASVREGVGRLVSVAREGGVRGEAALLSLARVGERWAGRKAIEMLAASKRRRRRGAKSGSSDGDERDEGDEKTAGSRAAERRAPVKRGAGQSKVEREGSEKREGSLELTACQVLARVRVAGGEAALRDLLRRSDRPELALCAAWGLGGYLGKEGVEETLRASLHALDPAVACNAAAALARFGRSRTARATLRELLDSPNDCFRGNAAVAMGRLGVRESVPKLFRLAQLDPEVTVRINALRALWLLQGRKKLAGWLRPQAWRQADPMVRAAVVDLLDGVQTVRCGSSDSKHFVAMWLVHGDEPSEGKRFRLVLPCGITLWATSARFGFAVFDGVSRGSAELILPSPEVFPTGKSRVEEKRSKPRRVRP
jgi:HEAT repeat protein